MIVNETTQNPSGETKNFNISNKEENPISEMWKLKYIRDTSPYLTMYSIRL